MVSFNLGWTGTSRTRKHRIQISQAKLKLTLLEFHSHYIGQQPVQRDTPDISVIVSPFSPNTGLAELDIILGEDERKIGDRVKLHDHTWQRFCAEKATWSSSDFLPVPIWHFDDSLWTWLCQISKVALASTKGSGSKLLFHSKGVLGVCPCALHVLHSHSSTTCILGKLQTPKLPIDRNDMFLHVCCYLCKKMATFPVSTQSLASLHGEKQGYKTHTNPAQVKQV